MQNHSFLVGSILYSRWGCEQTNIDFYQVTKVIGKTMLELQGIEQKETIKNPSNFSGTIAPVPDHFKDGSFRRRVNEIGSIRVDHGIFARIWHGEPLYFSTYG